MFKRIELDVDDEGNPYVSSIELNPEFAVLYPAGHPTHL